MTDLNDLVTALAAVLLALPAAYFTAKKRVETELHKRLDKISGGRVATLEDLVAEATSEKRLRRETPIAVYGGERLWADLRRGGFASANQAGAQPGAQGCEVAVIDTREVPEDRIAKLQEPYLLIYTEDGRYEGGSPPGALVTYANSSITLDARLMEALRHREARR